MKRNADWLLCSATALIWFTPAHAQQADPAGRATLPDAGPPLAQPVPPVPATSLSPDGARAGQTVSVPDPRTASTAGDIIVTAQKRAENVQNVPLSITVVSGDSIDKAGIVRFQDLSQSIPNFSVSANPISDTIALRGISSAGQAGSEQSVGVFVDGIYRGRGVQSRFAFLDLDHIEVLRGPQGTLFGRNTIAGAVNIATGKPTSVLDVELQPLYNFSFNEVDLRGHVAGPITDRLRGRLAFLYDDRARGWTYNIPDGQHYPKERDWALRGSLAYDLTDGIVLNARYEHGDVHQNGNSAELIKVGPSLAAAAQLFKLPGVSAGLDGVTSITNAIEPIPGIVDPPGQAGPVYLFDAKSNEASGQFDADLAGGTLTGIAGYSDYHFDRSQDADFSPVPVAQNIDAERFHQFSGELRYASDDTKPFYFLLGAFYQHEKLYSLQTGVLNYAFLDAFSCLAAGRAPGCSVLSSFGPGLTTRKIINQTANTWATFGQATYKPVRTVELTVGLRYGENHKDATQSALPYYEANGQLATGVPNALLAALPTEITPHTLSGRTSNKRLLPSVSLRWEFVPSVSVFARYAKGDQDGGFNAVSSSANPADLTFRPERSDDYEVGIKSVFADRRITLNANYYYVSFDDLQTTQFTGSTSYIVTNASSARAQGVEFDARVRLTKRFTLSGSGAYNDFKFVNFRNAGCTAAQLATGNNGAAYANAAACSNAGGNDLSGRTNENAPRFTFTGDAEYRQPIGDYSLTLVGEAQHSSSYYAATDLDPNLIQPDYTKYNATISFGPTGGRWEVALVGRNLTNKRTFFYGNDTPLFSGSFQVYVEQTRSIALRGNLHF